MLKSFFSKKLFVQSGPFNDVISEVQSVSLFSPDVIRMPVLSTLTSLQPSRVRKLMLSLQADVPILQSCGHHSPLCPVSARAAFSF